MRARMLISIFILIAVLGGQSFAALDLEWVRRVGGGASDIPWAVAVDGEGNVITAGNFSGTVDFDPGPMTVNLTAAGSSDAFVFKLDPAGNFAWARQLTGPASPVAYGVAADGSGNVVLVGSFSATVDFDPGAGVFNLTSNGLTDAFAVGLGADGTFRWADSWGGTSSDVAQAVAVDGGGHAHVVGPFQGTVDFDPGAGTTLMTSAGGTDVYVSKLDLDGGLSWSRALGGSSFENARSVAVDSDGNVYTLGTFQQVADFDPGPGSFAMTSAGDLDAFVSKLDVDGTFVWARQLGGFTTDDALGIALDATGNVHAVGIFGGTADFDPGPGTANLTSAGSADVFVSKLDATGNYLWARRIGGTGFDQALAVAVAADDHVFTGGNFPLTVDFDPGVGTFELTAVGNQPDAFVSELDSEGQFVAVYAFTGSALEEVIALAVVPGGGLQAAGRLLGTTDFDPGPGVTNLTSAGSSDVFVLRLDGGGAVVPDVFEVEIVTTAARTFGTAGIVYSFGVTVTGDANLIDVTVTPPGGGSALALSYDAVADAYELVRDGYATLDELRADFPLGDYLLEFNGGSQSVQLDYSTTEPACFADITSPTAACIVSPTPTLTWTVPAGCSASAVDVGLDDAASASPVFDLSFVPAASGSITLPGGPVTPPPVDPLPPLSPLVVGDSYVLGVDVVEGTLANETLGTDNFDFLAAFRNDTDSVFTVSDADPVLVLQLDDATLAWACPGADATGFDVVRGDLPVLVSSGGDFTNSTLDCLADDYPATSIANGDAPGIGDGYWYLVREVRSGGPASYTSEGAGELPGRDAEIVASGADCP